MSHRPLAIVSGLAIGDYLLWNWSLNGSHDVLALVSGLTLPPLAAALVWLIALTAVRLMGRAARRPPERGTVTAATASPARPPKQSRAIARSRRAVRRAAAGAAASRRSSPATSAHTSMRTSAASPAASTSSQRTARSSRKLAA